MKRERIDTYVNGGAELAQSILGLTHEQLHTRPSDGSWTIHQIVIHMLDSDLIASDRMKRIACMDKPLLIGYDENGFLQLPGVTELCPFSACDQFTKNRQFTATVLYRLPDSAWDRFGIHNERGKVTLTEMLDMYIHHLEHHLDFLNKKRALVSGGSQVTT